VANKARLRSDLAEEWGDVSTVRGGRCRDKNIRESEAVVGIEQWAGFAVRPLIDAEKCRIEAVSFRPKEGRRRRVIVRYEDDGF
jgi:hypothetical protein